VHTVVVIHQNGGAYSGQAGTYPAIVARPDWTVIMADDAATRWRRLFVSDAKKERLGPEAANAMKAFFDPRLLRPFVVNWEMCAQEILLRLRYESAGLGPSLMHRGHVDPGADVLP
jgi:MmyB-like transcription regulator ligand binding domain